MPSPSNRMGVSNTGIAMRKRANASMLNHVQFESDNFCGLGWAGSCSHLTTLHRR